MRCLYQMRCVSSRPLYRGPTGGILNYPHKTGDGNGTIHGNYYVTVSGHEKHVHAARMGGNVYTVCYQLQASSRLEQFIYLENLYKYKHNVCFSWNDQN